MAVDANISDLFFNYDTEAAKRFNSRKQFTGYDGEKFREIAEQFLSQLTPICSVQLPTVEELMSDFSERL